MATNSATCVAMLLALAGLDSQPQSHREKGFDSEVLASALLLAASGTPLSSGASGMLVVAAEAEAASAAVLLVAACCEGCLPCWWYVSAYCLSRLPAVGPAGDVSGSVLLLLLA
jgi:hypothetical protein